MTLFKVLKSVIVYIQFVFSIYFFYLNESENNLKKLKKSANQCGPLGIKLIQFILMRNVFKTKNLDFFLEDCNFHTFQETKEMYLSDFGVNLETDFVIEIERPVGSGSIGQVYKAFDLKSRKFVALKVKHPNINEDVTTFIKAIRIILRLFNFKWKYIISEYIDNINSQLDYQLEANNTIKLRESFKDETLVIVPEIYNYSENFIIMEYIPGISFENCDKKVLYSMYTTFIFMISVFCFDLLHGDLHYGNWKITENGSIVIYDSGIVYTSNDLNFNKNLMYYVLNGNYEKLLHYVKADPKKIKKVINLLKIENEGLIAGDKIKNFLNRSLEYRLIKNKYLINLLNCVGILGETQKISLNIFTKYVYTPGDSNAVMIYTYIDLLNKMGIFKELKTFFEKWMAEDPENKIVHNEWLMENFGHTESIIVSDIIYSKLI